MRDRVSLGDRLVLMVFAVVSAITPATFGQGLTPTSERLRALAEDVGAGRRDAAAAFWAEMTTAGTPLVEAGEDGTTLVTFLWRETEPTDRVAIMGGPGGCWLPTRRASSSMSPEWRPGTEAPRGDGARGRNGKACSPGERALRRSGPWA